jgi:hypothetical protein
MNVRTVLLAASLAAAGLAAPAVRAQEEPAGSGAIDRDALRSLARQSGDVRIRGRRHLAGVVAGESVHVEPGAEVTIEAGTVIYAVGDVRIDAPVRGVAPPPIFGPKKIGKGALIGDPGADVPDLVVICEDGNYTQNDIIELADGGEGQCVAGFGTSGQAGPGGKGGGIRIECPGTVTINANVVPGRGGKGGCADITGADGAAGATGQSVRWACGGNGGRSGDVRIVAQRLVFEVDGEGKLKGKIALRPGGVGGDAEAKGGAGGDAADCFFSGGHGGDALARAGNGGRSTRAYVEVEQLEPADVDAHDIAGYLGTERADGGKAVAAGGKGGSAVCVLETMGECPRRGRKGGKGGFGGAALALGGAGFPGGFIGDAHGALSSRQQGAAETPPGWGGPAEAYGGDGGFGNFGETAQTPGRGGNGGNGGDGVSRGGRGASTTLARSFDGLMVGSDGPLSGGDGGSVVAFGGNGGNGGDGGNCCDRPGGKGGARGLGGGFGKAVATPGSAGFGFTNGNVGGVLFELSGIPGVGGQAGAACPPKPQTSAELEAVVTVTPNPVYEGITVLYSIDIKNPGAQPKSGVNVRLVVLSLLKEWTVDVPAGTAAGPGVTHLEFEAPAPPKATGYTARADVNGLTLARFVFDVVKAPCVVVFTPTTLDYGTIYGDKEYAEGRDYPPMYLQVFNPSTTSPVQVRLPLTNDGLLFFDPHDPTGTLWPTLDPGETIQVEVALVAVGIGPFSREYWICGQKITVTAFGIQSPP